MPKMYKLVSQDFTTHGGMKWEIGKTNKATIPGIKMCTNQVLHCYSDPRLAVLFNPIHANINDPILLEIECSDIVNSDGLKHACKEQTPIRVITIPVISLNQKVAFAIKCAMKFYKEKNFTQWANEWLNGINRTAEAARAAARTAAWAAAGTTTEAARDAARDAARAAARTAARAAETAAWAAAGTTEAARTADWAAGAAAWAAETARDAARAAAWAAARAAETAAWAAARASWAAEDNSFFKETIHWVMENIDE